MRNGVKQRELQQRVTPFLLLLITSFALLVFFISYQWRSFGFSRFSPDIHRSLPDAMAYLQRKSRTCAQTKSRPDNVEYRGGVWQVVANDAYESVVYNAFYDNRTSVGDNAVIRVFAVASHAKDVDIFCQLWYDELKTCVPVRAAVEALGRGADINGTQYMEYLYSCSLSTSLFTPTHLSVSFRKCGPSTVHMPIYFANESDRVKEFGVCVPVTYWHVNPFRIIEWMELNKLYGVGEVNIYNSSIFMPGLRVFLRYQDVGDLVFHQAPPPVDGGFFGIKLAVLAALNDCMYRNMYRYRYLIAVDLDEMIIPRTAANYTDMMTQIHRDTHAQGSWPAYMFRNAYFWTDYQPNRKTPHFSMMLRYLTRTEVSPMSYAAKSIIDPRTCVVLTNHYCSKRVPTVGNFWTVGVNDSIATNQHYKKCHFSSTDCDKSLSTAIYDDSAERYRDALTNQIFSVLSALDMDNMG